MQPDLQILHEACQDVLSSYPTSMCPGIVRLLTHVHDLTNADSVKSTCHELRCFSPPLLEMHISPNLRQTAIRALQLFVPQSNLSRVRCEILITYFTLWKDRVMHPDLQVLWTACELNRTNPRCQHYEDIEQLLFLMQRVEDVSHRVVDGNPLEPPLLDVLWEEQEIPFIAWMLELFSVIPETDLNCPTFSRIMFPLRMRAEQLLEHVKLRV